MAAHSFIKLDPAVERWNRMREDAYKHFRFTPRTTFVSLMGFVFVPGAIYYLSTQTTNKWSWAGKRKDQALAKQSS
ncbi:hypothetical protein CONPUDRAFT_150105 [Coniophora puteana RWD-64-598 SS2]|uniref:NADH dehydrogenase [ubiquinone] 1 beta subcomplex subunit 4 n=1 Tax=Coniophora puteana (strain RWD-64-598) TaxID=741705 RepID=A0A5M3N1M5_CONPW|nr:uncharacterized protein CONPUDRAFT_150105 [Coniophora puteana RWD-64-598 SS2]EIW85283.1 hypothetical protein CONPUDRAFT_150105 [Coniophora puteana RWD-64-598 SS2]